MKATKYTDFEMFLEIKHENRKTATRKTFSPICSY